MLTKGMQIRLTITGLHHDGFGVVKHNNHTILVENAITDEDVTVEINKRKGSTYYAHVIETHTASEHRIQPKCEHFGVCSACSWQHISKELQIKTRTEQVKTLFRHANLTLPEDIIEPVFLTPYQYRRRARMSVRFDKKKEQVYVGFREKNPRFIAKINECQVLVQPKWPLLWREMLIKLECKDTIPQLEYMSGEKEESFVIRMLEVPSIADIKILHEFMNHHDIRIFIQAHSSLNVLELTDNPDYDLEMIQRQKSGNLTESNASIDYLCGDITLKSGVFDFIQVNKEITSWMLRSAVSWLQPQAHESLIDLCCGLGPFALTFAPLVTKVHGIELENSMVEKAHAHAKAYGITNVSFEACDLFNEPKLHDKYDLLIIDPPRPGLQHLSTWVKNCNPRSVLYVSCHAKTMVEDIAPLLNSGEYKIDKLAIMNMFAQTKHIEVMILLTRVD